MCLSLIFVFQCKVSSSIVFEAFRAELNTADVMTFTYRASLCIVLFITLMASCI